MEIKLSQITDIGGTEPCVDIEWMTIVICNTNKCTICVVGGMGLEMAFRRAMILDTISTGEFAE